MTVTILTELVGKTASKVYRAKDQLIFEFTNGESYCFKHYQDCCENVTIEDIVGELADLEGAPLLMAEEVSHSSGDDDFPTNLIKNDEDSYTWTFYKFATSKGYVTVRWFGSSNGYYSEDVSLCKMEINK